MQEIVSKVNKYVGNLGSASKNKIQYGNKSSIKSNQDNEFDNSNPTTTNDLLKTSPTTKEMTTLPSNNLDVQELVPDYLKVLQKEPECFYVIYKGPHVGLHTDWGIDCVTQW